MSIEGLGLKGLGFRLPPPVLSLLVEVSSSASWLVNKVGCRVINLVMTLVVVQHVRKGHRCHCTWVSQTKDPELKAALSPPEPNYARPWNATQPVVATHPVGCRRPWTQEKNQK